MYGEKYKLLKELYIYCLLSIKERKGEKEKKKTNERVHDNSSWQSPGNVRAVETAA